jgi:CRISPR-associated endonuclease/helicase Cas3
MKYYGYWAKTKKGEDFDIHLLPYHSLDVAACLYVLLENEPTILGKIARLLQIEREEALKLLVFLFVLHDGGKFGWFQRQSETALALLGKGFDPLTTPLMRHDNVIHFLFQMRLQKDLEAKNILTCDDPVQLENLFACVAGHHGYPTPFHLGKSKTSYFSCDAKSRDHVRQQFKGEAYTDLLDFANDVSAFLGTPYVDLLEVPESNLALASWIIAGLGTLADWLGSSTEFFAYRRDIIPLEEYWEHHALPQAKRAILESGVLPAPIRKASHQFEGLLPANCNLRPLQEWVKSVTIEPGPKLVIVEDAPGSGKTEVAMALLRLYLLSSDATGWYWALPTQASSNAMFERTYSFCTSLFDPGNVGTLALAHGSSNLSQLFRKLKFGPSNNVACTSWLGDSKKKSFLSQIGVGTIDQALISVLPKFHNTLRLASFARNILVVDEVHAYQSYQITLLCELLNYMAKMGIPAILLSATLPFKMRQRLVEAYASGMNQTLDKDPSQSAPYPLVTTVSPHGKVVEHAPKAHARTTYTLDYIEDLQPLKSTKHRIFSDAEKMASAKILHTVSTGQCAIWFRNTVRDALMAYRHLRRVLGPENVILAHSRYTRFRRSEIDRLALRLFGKDGDPALRAGKVVICTQVFQESLDLDFDHCICDLAPIDILIQRFGRVRRHKRRRDGTLIDGPDPDERGGTVPISIIMPSYATEPNRDWSKTQTMFVSSRYVYDVNVLWNTARMIVENNVWRLPEDVRYLMESVYGDAALEPEGMIQAILDSESRYYADQSMAHTNSLDLWKGYYGNSDTWGHEEQGVPTRLGSATKTWRLSRYDETSDRIVPFERGSWSYSELSLRLDIMENQLYPDSPSGTKIRRALERQSASPSDGIDPWANHLVMFEQSDGSWKATGTTKAEKPVFITYHEITGLEYEK